MYGGNPLVVGFALPSFLYLIYLRFPDPPLAGPQKRLSAGMPVPAVLPGANWPAVIVLNAGTNEPFSRLELNGLGPLAEELLLGGISLHLVANDMEEKLKLSLGDAPVVIHADPDRKIAEQFGCVPIAAESSSVPVVPAFFYADQNRVLRMAFYSSHLCERLGPEAALNRLERELGIVIPDEATVAGKSGDIPA